MNELLKFINENPDKIAEGLVVLYEVIVRLLPTKNNLSIIDGIFKLITILLPNRSKKALCIVLLSIISFGSFAQLNGNFKSVRLTVNDTVTTMPINGTIIYNTPTQEFYGYENFHWVPLGGSGGTTYLPFVYPEDYGAVGNGSTNDAAAITAAIATGQPVYFSKKNYRVNTAISIPSNTQIIGSGEGSIISTVANISIFDITGDNSDISHLTFLGNDAGAVQTGIAAIGNAGLTLFRISNRVSNCKFIDLNRAGIYVQEMVGSPSTNNQGAIYAINCVASSCANGYFMGARGEYNTFANCVAYLCTNGIQLLGGNNNFVGGQITNCSVGIRFGAGTNDGHGVISGMKINHNTTNVFSNGILLGYLFNGCMLYVGNVSLVSSAGFRFEACEFSTTAFTITNSAPTNFTSCKFITTPTFAITGTAPTFFNNYYIAGVIPTGTQNTLTGQLITSPTSTLSGFNTGSLAGDPSTLTNGDIWYNSSLPALRARINGASVSLGAGGTGITNVSAINEIPRTVDGSGNLGISGIESLASGDLNLGLSTLAGAAHTIRANASGAITSLTLAAKGTTGQVIVRGNEAGAGVTVFSEAGINAIFQPAGALTRIWSVGHGSNNNGIEQLSTSTSTYFRGGHSGTTTKMSMGIESFPSSTNGVGGDDIFITPGTGSSGAGHTSTPGGNIILTGGAGGAGGSNNGGNITISGGAQNAGGTRGNVFIINLPTSAAGLPTGALYSNLGVLTLAP